MGAKQCANWMLIRVSSHEWNETKHSRSGCRYWEWMRTQCDNDEYTKSWKYSRGYYYYYNYCYILNNNNNMIFVDVERCFYFAFNIIRDNLFVTIRLTDFCHQTAAPSGIKIRQSTVKLHLDSIIFRQECKKHKLLCFIKNNTTCNSWLNNSRFSPSK